MSWYSNVFSFGEGITIVFKKQCEVSNSISSWILVIVESLAVVQDMSPRFNRI